MRLEQKALIIGVLASQCVAGRVTAQINEDQLGAWYVYLFSTTIKESPWGVQGDVQYRSWNLGSDMEQLLLRAGVTYKPRNADVKFTVGYANITNGAPGEEISNTISENRVYQEVLFPVSFGSRCHTNHRLRYEQRSIDGQDFRTRYRYGLFLNIALNGTALDKGTFYLAVYDELFINGQRDIGNGRTVELFDRNRLYGGLGYVVNRNMRVQLGILDQTTDLWSKDQLQLSLQHQF